MRVRIKKLSETAVIPTRGSRQAAGYDLCADIREPLVMRPGESVKVDTDRRAGRIFWRRVCQERAFHEKGDTPGQLCGCDRCRLQRARDGASV